MMQKATATLYQFIIGLFRDGHLICHYNRAVARFFKLGVGGWGIIMSAEGTSLVGGVWGYPPPKNFKFRGSKFYPRILLASTLVTCTGCAITGNLCKLE